LTMHIQLLTTSFLCTYDFPYLHNSVTRPCASTLKQLTSLRDAFDLLVHEHRAGTTEAPAVRSFYWSATTLDDAVHLISDYAGLSVLPQLSLSNRPLLMSSDDSNTFRTQSTRVITNLPLPYCLIRLMTHNPIWSYAALMPATLPTNSEPADELTKSRKRIGINPAEDALLLMGLADFHGARLSPEEGDTECNIDPETGEPVCQPGKYASYQFIRKHLLPFRTMLQLRSRRWNLVGSKRGCANVPPEQSTPTDKLAQLFRSLSQQKTLKCAMLAQLTKDLAEQAVPYRVSYRH
uniref:PX domain-containing protein n=1 Tax=Echinostoma caproni TaxID=27848 RepID=A0A183A4T3_9TREM